MDGAIDIDVLYKATVYELFDYLLESVPLPLEGYCVLATARFVIHGKIEKTTFSKNRKHIKTALQNSLALVTEIEPTIDELGIASELEFMASKLNVSFDTGESQLCAMLISRNMQCLITGDKRAISAAELMLHHIQSSNVLKSKFICLEQCFLWLLERFDPLKVREAVCSELKIDRSLSICFSCHSPNVPQESWTEGLNSYVSDLRSKAPSVLFNS